MPTLVRLTLSLPLCLALATTAVAQEPVPSEILAPSAFSGSIGMALPLQAVGDRLHLFGDARRDHELVGGADRHLGGPWV